MRLKVHHDYICASDVHGEISDAQGEAPQASVTAAVVENTVMTPQRDKSLEGVGRSVATRRGAFLQLPADVGSSNINEPS